MLDRAHEDLSSGNTDRAVRRAYGIVRSVVAGSDPSLQTLTHWELLQQYRDKLDGESDQSGVLERLTQVYEVAAYAPDRVGRGAARDALESAGALLELFEDEPAD
jgi:hypothetical protein